MLELRESEEQASGRDEMMTNIRGEETGDLSS
jgi:hypothetical protein